MKKQRKSTSSPKCGVWNALFRDIKTHQTMLFYFQMSVNVCVWERDFLLVYKPLSRPVVLIKTNCRLCLCDRKQYIVSQLSTTTLQNQNCLWLITGYSEALSLQEHMNKKKSAWICCHILASVFNKSNHK